MTINRIFQRITVVVALCIFVFILPWWATLALTLLALTYFHRFVEACAVAVLFDVAYAAIPLFGIPGFATLFMIAAYIVWQLIASHLRRDVFTS